MTEIEPITMENCKNCISNTSKMGKNVYSWSLPAGGQYCPGSKNQDGSYVEACYKCYARKNFYLMPSAKNARLNNVYAWQKDEWVPEMVSFLTKKRKVQIKYFRFFDSGDCYSLRLAEKIFQLVSDKRVKDIHFWIPTRMYKFNKFRAVFEKMNLLPNVVVRFSSNSITGQLIDGLCTSTILSNHENNNPNIFVCPSSKQKGKCVDCKECWNKNRKNVAYILH